MNTKKQEVIKQAYEAHWKVINKYVDDNGWLESNDTESPIPIFVPSIGELEEHPTDLKFRPLSLKGIENNNGWIKLNGTINEIKYEGDIFIINKNGEIEINLNGEYLELGDATHYQPITKPLNPLY